MVDRESRFRPTPIEDIHSVMFRKSDGGVVITHHDSRDAALETAADVRAAFPWLQVAIVPGKL
jgi:hypothetical protein